MNNAIIDKDFGILQYVEDFDGNAYWSGLTLFKNCLIDLHFIASGVNPTDLQRQFLMTIDNKYEEIVSTIFTILPKALKENNLFLETNYFIKQFRPKAILLENLINDYKWSFTFQSMTNSKHFLTVQFNGLKAIKSTLEK